MGVQVAPQKSQSVPTDMYPPELFGAPHATQKPNMLTASGQFAAASKESKPTLKKNTRPENRFIGHLQVSRKVRDNNATENVWIMCVKAFVKRAQSKLKDVN